MFWMPFRGDLRSDSQISEPTSLIRTLARNLTSAAPLRRQSYRVGGMCHCYPKGLCSFTPYLREFVPGLMYSGICFLWCYWQSLASYFERTARTVGRSQKVRTWLSANPKRNKEERPAYLKIIATPKVLVRNGGSFFEPSSC